MKILVFSTLFPHDGEPTLGVFVENRLRNLLAQETSVNATVVAPVPWFPFKSKLFGIYANAARAARIETRDGLKIYHPRYLVIPKVGMLVTPVFLYLSAWWCIKKILKSGERFDLIDAHYLYPDVVAASKLAKKMKIPFVGTARGSDVTQIGLMKRPRRLIQAAIKKAAHIITVSENLRRDIIDMGLTPSKITTLRNGVDLQKFQETSRKASRENFGVGPIMLFAGWLIPRKRLDLVLQVAQRVPHLKTVIVGDGPLRSWCHEEVERLGIGDRIVFAGQKHPDDMAEAYSMADVLLLPSDREGWANVLLEAMACGTPVVSRAIGGAPDLITEDVAGRLVDSDCPDILAKAVQDLLENQPKREAVRSFAEKFSWTETSTGQYEVFKAAVQE